MPLSNIRRICRSEHGNTRETTVAVDLDTSYPAGGYPLAPSSALFGGYRIVFRVVADPRGGYVFEYLPTTQRLKVFTGAAVLRSAESAKSEKSEKSGKAEAKSDAVEEEPPSVDSMAEASTGIDLSAIKNVRIKIEGL